ncbi:MAG TPA: hypothetical protein VGE07_07915 [Herpetosiphonaceae bacterium]
MALWIKGCLVLAGLINAYPLIGAFSAGRIEALYGLGGAGPDTLILLRHRAVLFGLLGGLMLYGAWRREFEGIAIAAGLISMLAFIWLAWQSAAPALRVVVIADAIGSALLVAAAVLRWRAG